MNCKDMIHKTSRIIRVYALTLLLIATHLLVACTPPLLSEISPMGCDQILETSTREDLYTQLADPEELAQSIVTIYHVPLSAIEVYDNPDQVPPKPDVQLRWQGERNSHNSNYYGIDITAGELAFSQIFFGDQRPTVNDVLRCLGTPSAYFAWYGPGLGEYGKGLAFWMFFPQRGVITFSNQQVDLADHAGADALIPLDVAQLPISWIRFSRVETTEALLLDRLTIDLDMDIHEEPGKTLLAWYTNAVKPWPGEMRQLKYTAVPYPDIPLR